MKDVIVIDDVSSFCAARAAQLFHTETTLAIYIHLGYKQDGLFRRRGYTVYAVDPLRCLSLGSYDRNERGEWCCVVPSPDLTEPMKQVVKAHLNQWSAVAHEGYVQEGVA